MALYKCQDARFWRVYCSASLPIDEANYLDCSKTARRCAYGHTLVDWRIVNTSIQ